MPKRVSRSDTEDTNEVAARIAREVTEEKPREKNPAAVALGRLGGSKGGKTRAKKLSKQRRIEIAKQAARARWEGPSQ